MADDDELDLEVPRPARRCEDCGGAIEIPAWPFTPRELTWDDGTVTRVPIFGLIFIDKYCEDCAENHEDDWD